MRASTTPVPAFPSNLAPPTSRMVLCTTPAQMQAACRHLRASELTLGLVPTMGALHAGHLSLVAAARRECDLAVVTIFVNPTQFAPGEDFERYPRTREADLAALAGAGADVVFAPPPAEIYRPGFSTFVDVGPIAEPWEGRC